MLLKTNTGPSYIYTRDGNSFLAKRTSPTEFFDATLWMELIRNCDTSSEISTIERLNSTRAIVRDSIHYKSYLRFFFVSIE